MFVDIYHSTCILTITEGKSKYGDNIMVLSAVLLVKDYDQ